MKYLFVDDNPIWRDLVYNWAGKLKLDYDIVSSGFEAIRMLQINKYDCLVTDIMMPEMSGFKLVEYIQQTYTVKIIVMSNHKEYLQMFPVSLSKHLKPNSIEEFTKILNAI